MLYFDCMRTLYDFSDKALLKFQQGDHLALIKGARKTTDYLPPDSVVLFIYTYEDERDAIIARLAKDFPNIGVQPVLSNKEHFAKKGARLVDDWKGNKSEWQKKGGIFWKFINKHNTIDPKTTNVKFKNTKHWFSIVDVLTGDTLYAHRKEEL